MSIRKCIIFLFINFIFFVGQANAGTITISTLSNDSQVSYSFLNTSFSTIKNTINGGIESSNIKDATITIDDMASTSSPAQREGDHFNPYTKTGMLPATSSDLTSDISAGTSYVESDAGLLYRIVTSATSKTYTASKDTWVFIDINGTFQYTAQTVGAAQPSTPSNSLLLAKVVTSGTAITSVVDHRVTSISLGATEDFYVKGMNLLWDKATDRMSVDTGTIRVGSSTVTKTSATGLNIGTAGDYITGVSERGTSKWLHIYAGPAGSSGIKFDDNAPDYHDTSGNTAGKKYYFKNSTDYWRYLGSIRLNATGSGEIVGFYWDGFGDSPLVMLDTPISITTTVSSNAWSAAISCATGIPPTSTRAVFGLSSTHSSAAQTGIAIRPNASIWATDVENQINSGGGGANSVVGGQRVCVTDSSQRIQSWNQSGSTSTAIDVEGFYLDR